MTNTVILYDPYQKTWLRYAQPVAVCSTRRLDEILPALKEIDRAVQTSGLHAVGFLSYEAAPAFDPALVTHPAGELPLLWFGLYNQPEAVELERGRGSADLTGIDWQPAIQREAYQQSIHHIKEQIALGNTYQVNFTLRLRSVLPGDPWALFLKLQQSQQAGYAAYLDLGRFVICCASPELFFRLEGEAIESRPMKGTARRGLTYEADLHQADWLYHSEKNRAENVMIVDMVRNDLGRIARTGSVQVDQLFQIERYPTVWQMTSTVSAQTAASLPEIMAALFPCASITGAPKPSTMKIIQAIETEPRQIYTGCIGFMKPGRRAQMNVAIRTVWIDRHTTRAEYGVGGGIVWDSTAEGEYEEWQTKASLLTHHWPDFKLLETCLWQPEEGYFLQAYHLKRMRESARYFDFPFDPSAAEDHLDTLAGRLKLESQLIRLLLDESGRFESQATPLKNAPTPAQVRLKLADQPVDSQNVFLYHKTTNRRVYDAQPCDPIQADDILLWNERGELTETRMANLLVRLEGAWLTPPVTCGLLAGTYRAWMLDQGLVREQILRVSDLAHCQEIALINSVRKLRPAILVGDSATRQP